MLTKKDLQESEARLEKRLSKKIDEAVKSGFADFYESIFLPSLERNEKDHEEIKQEMRDMREDLSEYIKDHEKRITKIEKTLATS